MAKCYLYAIEYTKYTKERVLSRSSLFEMEERWEYIERPAFDTQKIHKLAESEGNIPLISAFCAAMTLTQPCRFWRGTRFRFHQITKNVPYTIVV